ncbi:MAG: hypothetical protein IPJ88_16395 [Myxococcales bacterium]|nr:MAG: hypothetical protein IPJ88_16395 [Myxococcales bacterium]
MKILYPFCSSPSPGGPLCLCWLLAALSLCTCDSGSIGKKKDVIDDASTLSDAATGDGGDGSTIGIDEPIIPAADLPAWMEPHGIHLHDLVGNVPEAHLVNAIVSGFPGLGRYVSGARDGSTVTMRVRLNLRSDASGQYSEVSALGQQAALDQWPTVLPASELRLYDGTTEVTDKVISYHYHPAGLLQPTDGATSFSRYPVIDVTTNLFTETGALSLPAHRGCSFVMSSQYSELIAEFTLTSNNKIAVSFWLSKTLF